MTTVQTLMPPIAQSMTAPAGAAAIAAAMATPAGAAAIAAAMATPAGAVAITAAMEPVLAPIIRNVQMVSRIFTSKWVI